MPGKYYNSNFLYNVFCTNVFCKTQNFSQIEKLRQGQISAKLSREKGPDMFLYCGLQNMVIFNMEKSEIWKKLRTLYQLDMLEETEIFNFERQDKNYFRNGTTIIPG